VVGHLDATALDVVLGVVSEIQMVAVEYLVDTKTFNVTVEQNKGAVDHSVLHVQLLSHVLEQDQEQTEIQHLLDT